MKANRKFRQEDDAVSPVIAVILMVAITVVLAATVYVWVSGFGSNTSAPAKSVSLTSAGAIANQGSLYWKNYTFASASPGMKYNGLKLVVAGVSFTGPDGTACADSGASTFSACAGSTARTATSLIVGGDQLELVSGTSLSGQTLQIADPNSNSIILTLTIS